MARTPLRDLVRSSDFGYAARSLPAGPRVQFLTKLAVGAAIAFVLGIALVAATLAGHRGTRVEPMRVLRKE